MNCHPLGVGPRKVGSLDLLQGDKGSVEVRRGGDRGGGEGKKPNTNFTMMG